MTLRQRFGERVRFERTAVAVTPRSASADRPTCGWRCETAAEICSRCSAWRRAAGMPLFVIGIGTNVLVSDRGVRGIVVKLGRALGELRRGSETAKRRACGAGAAAPFKKLVVEARGRDAERLRVRRRNSRVDRRRAADECRRVRRRDVGRRRSRWRVVEPGRGGDRSAVAARADASATGASTCRAGVIVTRVDFAAAARATRRRCGRGWRARSGARDVAATARPAERRIDLQEPAGRVSPGDLIDRRA